MNIRATPSPYLSVASRALAPVVLTCEHASNRLPFGGRLGVLERAALAAHWGWDIGAWELTRELARRLGTSAVGGRWSRLVIDLNRRVDEPGLIRRDAGGVSLSWNDPVPPEEVERRVLAYHAPYHLEIDRLILSRVVRGVRPLLFSVHTFTPELRGRRRSFEVGVLYDRHARLAHRLARRLRGAGLDVRYNQPYSGKRGLMYSAERHGTHHDLPCLELEVNQGLFARRSAASRLGRVVADGLGELLRTLPGTD